MSIDEKKSDNTDVLRRFIREVRKGDENALEVSRMVGKDGEEVKTTVAMVNRRVQPERPLLARSPRRAHVFHDGKSLVDYIRHLTQLRENAFSPAKMAILSDSQAGIIQVILDDSSSTGFEILEVRPLIHPLFAEWDRAIIDSRHFSQENFTDFIIKNHGVLKSPNYNDFKLLLQQLKFSTKIDIDSGFGNGSFNAVRYEINVAGAKDIGQIEFPENLKIEVPIYAGTEPTEINIDIILQTAGRESISVTMVCGELQMLKFAAWEKMNVRLQKQLEVRVKNLHITNGKCNFAELSYESNARLDPK